MNAKENSSARRRRKEAMDGKGGNEDVKMVRIRLKVSGNSIGELVDRSFFSSRAVKLITVYDEPGQKQTSFVL